MKSIVRFGKNESAIDHERRDHAENVGDDDRERISNPFAEHDARKDVHAGGSCSCEQEANKLWRDKMIALIVTRNACHQDTFSATTNACLPSSRHANGIFK